MNLQNFSCDARVVHMYYLMMETTVRPILKSKTYCISKSYTRLKEKEISLVNSKFYQKLFVFLITFSTILIFPESPRKLENICESYNSHIYFPILLVILGILKLSKMKQEEQEIFDRI